eukprot:6735357-Pyramimonas_sp.AAC.1
MGFWRGLRSPGRNSNVASRRCSPKNGILTRFRMFKRLSSNGCLLPVHDFQTVFATSLTTL